MQLDNSVGLSGPIPSRDSEAFTYWSAKNVLPEVRLLQSLAMAQECIQLIRMIDLTHADEAFPRLILETIEQDDITY